MNAQIIDDSPAQAQDEALLAELFHVLSNRRKTEDERLDIGVAQSSLLKALGLEKPQLIDLISQLESKIAFLEIGVEEFYYQNETRYAILSNKIQPNELNSSELSLLGVVITLFEQEEDQAQQKITTKKLSEKVVDKKYMLKTQFEKALRQLIYLGYLENTKRGLIQYGMRTLLEYPKTARQRISQEGDLLIL